MANMTTPRGWEKTEAQTAGGSWIPAQRSTPGPVAPASEPWTVPNGGNRDRESLAATLDGLGASYEELNCTPERTFP